MVPHYKVKMPMTGGCETSCSLRVQNKRRRKRRTTFGGLVAVGLSVRAVPGGNSVNRPELTDSYTMQLQYM